MGHRPPTHPPHRPPDGCWGVRWCFGRVLVRWATFFYHSQPVPVFATPHPTICPREGRGGVAISELVPFYCRPPRRQGWCSHSAHTCFAGKVCGPVRSTLGRRAHAGRTPGKHSPFDYPRGPTSAVKAFALLRVGPAQSSETGAVRGLRWHTRPRKGRGCVGGNEDRPEREIKGTEA